MGDHQARLIGGKADIAHQHVVLRVGCDHKAARNLVLRLALGHGPGHGVGLGVAQVRHTKLGQFAPSGFQVGTRQGPCMGLGECVQGVVV